MSDSSLFLLYRLHLIDSEIAEIKARASALDGGKQILAQIAALKERYAGELNGVSDLKKQIAEGNEKTQVIAAKIAELEKKLFSGSVVNPKEAAGFELEIEAFKGQLSTVETATLEAMDALPAAEQAAAPVQKKMRELAKQYEVKHKADIQESDQIKEKYRLAVLERNKRVSEVPKPLLDQYELIRKKAGGIGMAVIDSKHKFCGACSTNIPEKVMNALDSDRLVTCENCHRLLFKPVHSS